MKTSAILASALLALAATAHAVPTEINYQGVLTDQNGNPVNGVRAMQIKIYDAPTGGTLLYSEDLGNVPVQDGIYSFSFGANGTSNALTTETVAIANGTVSTFQKVLAAPTVVAGSVTVTDGTYTWDQTNGSSNENDFGVVYNSGLRRVTVTYYNGAPDAGRTINTTYRSPASRISGALVGENQPWVEITVDGLAQVPRQKILTVPYAARAHVADSVASMDPATASSLQEISNLIQFANITGTEMPGHFTDHTRNSNSRGDKGTFAAATSNAAWDSGRMSYVSDIKPSPLTEGFGSGGAWGWALLARTIVHAKITRITGTLSGLSQYYNNADISLIYEDGTSHTIRRGNGAFDISNPRPDKVVHTVDYYSGTPSNQPANINVSSVTLYPLASQRRYVDLDLSSQGITASAVTLVTNETEISRNSFQVFAGPWISGELSCAEEHTIPRLAITRIRIYLNYDATSSTFVGASLQGYSLKYR